MVEAISRSGLVKVVLEYIGEGMDGDYTGKADDIPLLRFDVCRSVDDEWEDVEDASYCTQIPADTTKKDQLRLAFLILKDVENEVECGTSIKKRCEALSWIGPTWGTAHARGGWTLDDVLEQRLLKKKRNKRNKRRRK